ncbi:hypothetical protein RRG08_004350 [Elysia crispata]|uniref:Uncharacterized protein n=1 Tax=Elysia crispata TaxID=231223 RepID=A0AAE1AZL9_9GAST|nr:hypothetical protein RRG08_004350 [Elysia crispata]
MLPAQPRHPIDRDRDCFDLRDLLVSVPYGPPIISKLACLLRALTAHQLVCCILLTNSGPRKVSRLVSRNLLL